MSGISRILGRVWKWLTNTPWYRRSEWVQVDTTNTYKVLSENGCSWDVRVYWTKKYQHKETGDLRYRGFHSITKTIFTKPEEKYADLDKYDEVVYKGGKYD